LPPLAAFFGPAISGLAFLFSALAYQAGKIQFSFGRLSSGWAIPFLNHDVESLVPSLRIVGFTSYSPAMGFPNYFLVDTRGLASRSSSFPLPSALSFANFPSRFLSRLLRGLVSSGLWLHICFVLWALVLSFIGIPFASSMLLCSF
jgi:hypothetical protein